MRMGNPSMRRILHRAESGETTAISERATYGGIAKKSLLFGAVTFFAALITALLLRKAFVNQDELLLTVVLVGAAACAIPMLIVSLVVSFVPSTVKILGVVYSLLQGCLLGVLVFFADAFFPGVAVAAVLGTLIVFVVSVVLNKFLEVKISNKFFRGMLIAFISLFVLELLLFVISLFVPNLNTLFTVYLWVQLGISLFCVVYATIMLLWDLQMAESIVNIGADKKYEWQVAFSLVTTIVYMYIEILELILRIVMLFNRNKN